MLDFFGRYGPRANPADSNYPRGSIKNDSTGVAGDGTPLEADHGNDQLGFSEALVTEAGITPSGNPDTVLVSDRLNALKIVSQNFSDRGYTLAETIADANIRVGQTRRIIDRDNGRFNVVLASSVTPNGFNIIQCQGQPTLALVLLNTKYPGFTNISEVVNVRQWGAISSPVGATSGFNNSPVFTAIANHVTSISGGTMDLGDGRFYVATNVNIPIVDNGFGQHGIAIQGRGRIASEIFTDQDIDVFTHADRFRINAVSVRQLSPVTNAHKGVAFRSNGQCRFCEFSDVEIWSFKFGNLQRFSLWNSYSNVYYVDNSCGVKLARSADMEDQTNPSPDGSWNAGDGWFHNQNYFQNVVFNGGLQSNGGMGEIGFWGAAQGCTFENVTCQNYERPGTHVNTTIPLDQVSTGMEIVGGGPSSSNTFNNVITNYYVERTFKALKLVDNRKMSIDGWFIQGQSGGENMLEVDNSIVNITGQTGQTQGFSTRIKATGNSVIISDGELVAPGATDDIESGSYYNPNGIHSIDGDIGSTTRPFRDFYGRDAFFGTTSTNPFAGDDGVYIDGSLGRILASRNGPVMALNSRGVDGDVVTFSRSSNVVGSIAVYTAGGVLKTEYNTSLTTGLLSGNGSPEGVVTAGVGSTYTRFDGGANTTLYVKESGTGNTGWVFK